MSLPADFDPFEGPAPVLMDSASGAPRHARGDIAEIIRQALHAEDERRLLRTEAAVAGSSQIEREALCEWLGGMLHRPPLERPTAAWMAMRGLVEALWWDLADRTPDPLEPLGQSPNIQPNHPWGEGTEE